MDEAALLRGLESGQVGQRASCGIENPHKWISII